MTHGGGGRHDGQEIWGKIRCNDGCRQGWYWPASGLAPCAATAIWKNRKPSKPAAPPSKEAVSSETYYDHLSVEGVSLAGMTKDEAREALASKEKALRDPVDVSLTLGDESYSYTEADFSYQSNLEEVLEEAFAVAREGTEEEKLAAYQALMETPIDYALEVTLDDSNVETIVASLAEHLNQEASEGKLTFHPLEDKPFTYEGGKDGLKVDEEATCEALRALLAKDEENRFGGNCGEKDDAKNQSRRAQKADGAALVLFDDCHQHRQRALQHAKGAGADQRHRLTKGRILFL